VTKKLAWLSGGVIVLALVAVLTAPYRPSALGGSASYAVVTGDGMSPDLAPGDLAVFRPAASYAPDDVVAYETARGSAIARVVARRGDAYLLRQDAEGAPAVRAPAGRVSGLLDAVVPHAGGALVWLREPLHLLVVPAAAALAGGVLLLLGGMPPRLAGRRRSDSPERLPRRARRLVVPVRGGLELGDAVVEVRSLTGLVTLARRSGRIVLEVEDAGGRCWLVNGDDAVYRFRAPGPAPAAQAAAQAEHAREPAPVAPPLRSAEAGMLTAR
jgi:hypothetical protein